MKYFYVLLFPILSSIEITRSLQIAIENGSDLCEMSNVKYFELIGWYLGRAKDLSVAVLIDSESDYEMSYFASHFLFDFMNSKA